MLVLQSISIALKRPGGEAQLECRFRLMGFASQAGFKSVGFLRLYMFEITGSVANMRQELFRSCSPVCWKFLFGKFNLFPCRLAPCKGLLPVLFYKSELNLISIEQATIASIRKFRGL